MSQQTETQLEDEAPPRPDLTGMEIEQTAVVARLPRYLEGLASRVLVDVAELHGRAEDAHRQTQLVVLGEVDQVRFRDLPPLEDLGEREVRFVDVHSLPSAPIPV